MVMNGRGSNYGVPGNRYRSRQPGLDRELAVTLLRRVHSATTKWLVQCGNAQQFYAEMSKLLSEMDDLFLAE